MMATYFSQNEKINLDYRMPIVDSYLWKLMRNMMILLMGFM